MLYSSDPMPGTCGTTSPAGVACSVSQATTWNELARYNRPLQLELVTPERFAAAVLLLQIEDRNAILLGAEGPISVPLTTLAPHWQGGFRYLWHRPPAFERPLQRGDRGPAVSAIARQFAIVDGQKMPLTGSEFSSALEQRVRLFQRANNLSDDGVVGEQTLLRLNEQSGVDVTATEIIERFGAAGQDLSSSIGSGG
jgi:general secretion pathway protein A